jgi:hypothetical protein
MTSHKINQRLYFSGNNFPILICVILNIFWLERAECITQRIESPPAKEIPAQFPAIPEQMRDIISVNFGYIYPPSCFAKPASEKSTEVVFPVSGLAVESQPMNNNSSEYATSSKNSDNDGNDWGHYWGWATLAGIVGSFMGASLVLQWKTWSLVQRIWRNQKHN